MGLSLQVKCWRSTMKTICRRKRLKRWPKPKQPPERKPAARLSSIHARSHHDSRNRSLCLDPCALRGGRTGNYSHLRRCSREFFLHVRGKAGGAGAISSGPAGFLLLRLCLCSQGLLRTLCRVHVEFSTPPAVSTRRHLGGARGLLATVGIHSHHLDGRCFILLWAFTRGDACPYSRCDGISQRGISLIHA